MLVRRSTPGRAGGCRAELRCNRSRLATLIYYRQGDVGLAVKRTKRPTKRSTSKPAGAKRVAKGTRRPGRAPAPSKNGDGKHDEEEADEADEEESSAGHAETNGEAAKP